MTRTAALLVALVLAACSSPGGGGATGGGRSTDDPRVRSFKGTSARELAADGAWLGAQSSLARHQGRVVYLQFAFPQ